MEHSVFTVTCELARAKHAIIKRFDKNDFVPIVFICCYTTPLHQINQNSLVVQYLDDQLFRKREKNAPFVMMTTRHDNFDFSNT